jgi:DNA-binding transcriptional ArsR family regulator
MTVPLDSSFRALADATRREILDLLRNGSMTSGQIADRFESSWPTISRHLAILRDAGLVNAEREGQEIRYELSASVLEDVIHHLVSWTKGSPRGRRTARSPRAREREA